LLAKQGLPYFTGAFVITLITSNAAVTATFTHLFLFNYHEIKSAWSFASKIKRFIKNPNRSYRFWENSTDSRPINTTDPHVKLMMKYKDVPDWWYGLIFAVAVLLGIIICYAADTALPWWGFIVAMVFSINNILFFGAQYALTAWGINTQAMIQLMAAYLFPGRPITNMYFTLFGYQSVGQGFLLLRDLKMAQYGHLSPRCAFTMVISGTIVGAMVSYVVMNTIISNQEAHILGLDGTNAWSGQMSKSRISLDCSKL
jgi:OPT family oligopeptide transporter